jgi:hypothetical protein
MNPYRTMRDPLENKDLNLGMSAFETEDDELFRLFRRVEQSIKHIRDGMHIVSFTVDATEWPSPFGCAWARPRMWEQYGANHSGACLVFDRERALRVCQAQMNSLGVHYSALVNYTPEGFAGSQARNLLADRFRGPDPLSDYSAAYIEDHHEEFFFLKTSDWETEFEHRLALLGPGGDCVDLSFEDSLVAVVVGERFPDWQLPGARDLCAAASAELRQMHWADGRPFPLSRNA